MFFVEPCAILTSLQLVCCVKRSNKEALLACSRKKNRSDSRGSIQPGKLHSPKCDVGSLDLSGRRHLCTPVKCYGRFSTKLTNHRPFRARTHFVCPNANEMTIRLAVLLWYEEDILNILHGSASWYHDWNKRKYSIIADGPGDLKWNFEFKQQVKTI